MRVIPKNFEQWIFLDALLNPDIKLVTCFGRAGTGKTFLAVAMGVSLLLDGRVERIILSRPAVEAGERLGFLPGPDVVDLSGPLAG